MKKLMCLLTALTLVMSVSMVARADNVSYPTADDYKAVIEYDGTFLAVVYNNSWVPQIYDAIVSFGSTVSGSVTNSSSGRIVIRTEYDFTELLQPYFTAIVNSTNVWFSLKQNIEYTAPDGGSGTAYISYLYDLNDGNGRVSQMGNSFSAGNTASGEVLASPTNFTTTFKGATAINEFAVRQDVYLSPYEGTIPVSLKVEYFVMTIYLQGIDGTDNDQFIVISNKMDEIESAVKEVKQEIVVMQGQLNDINDSINQGFDSVLNPDSGDKELSDQFGSDLSDKKEESDNLQSEMEKLDKPTFEVDDINPLDKVNEEDVQFVGSTLTVFFESNTLMTFATMALVFAFLGYILYGKRG